MMTIDAHFFQNGKEILVLEFDLDDNEDLETFQLQLEAQYPNYEVSLSERS